MFYLRIGSHSPIQAIDSKINLPRWKITHPDFVLVIVHVRKQPMRVQLITAFGRPKPTWPPKESFWENVI